MLVLRPTMADEERDQELAKFQAFLQKEGATGLSDLVRGRQRLAYPIKRCVVRAPGGRGGERAGGGRAGGGGGRAGGGRRAAAVAYPIKRCFAGGSVPG